jgi:thiol:disulfide interchange protein DsbD
MKRWFGSLLLVLMLSAPCLAEEDFLEPEDAFRFSARLVSDQLLEVQYQIADGYYMYRDRFRFEVEPHSVVLGEPRFPDGESHEDEFFGRSVVYRMHVTIQIPIVSGIDTVAAIRLVAVSQGCADGGICYLPTRQTADFETLGIAGGAR